MWKLIKLSIFLIGYTCVRCQGKPPAPIKCRATYLPSERTIRVQWDNPQGYTYKFIRLEGNKQGEPLRFDYRGSKVTFIDIQKKNSYDIQPPELDTTYTLTVAGYVSNTWSQNTAEFSVKTPSPDTKPTNVGVSYTGNRVVTVSWSAPSEGAVKKYVVLYRYNATLVIKKEVPSRPTSLITRNLTFDTLYRLQIYAVLDDDTFGAPSDERDIKLVPQTFNIVDGGSSALSLQGDDKTSDTWDIKLNDRTIYSVINGKVVTGADPPSDMNVQVLDSRRRVKLSFFNAKPTTAGTYKLVQRNDQMVLDVKVIIFSVKPSTPTISQSPRDAVQGLPITLTCYSRSNSKPVTHNLKLSYYWKVDDVIITTSAKYSKNDSQLLIQSLDVSDRTNQYSCVAAEEKGLTSDPGSHAFNILYGPENMTINPNPSRNITATEGSSIGPYICSSACNPVCTIIWRGKTANDSSFVRAPQSSASNVLSIVSVKRQEEGTYRCVADARAPIPKKRRKLRSNDITIDVKYAPSITRTQYTRNSERSRSLGEETSVQVRENDMVTLSMDTDADPDANIKLLKGQHQNEGDAVKLLNVNYDNVQCDQTGNYTFEASNTYSGNSPVRRRFKIYVFCKPRAKRQDFQREFGGKRSDILTFKAPVISYPAPTVKWNQSVQALPVTKVNEFTYRISGRVTITAEKDYGVYTATVNNTYGNFVLEFVVRPEDKPDAPSNFTALNILQTSVNLTWISRFDGGSTQTFKIDVEDPDVPNTWKAVEHDIQDGGQNSVVFYDVSDLTPGKDYTFRLFSSNKNGESQKIFVSVTTQASPEQLPVDGGGGNTAMIAGAAGAGAVFLIALVVIVVFFVRKKKNKSGNRNRNANAGPVPDNERKDDVIYAIPDKPKGKKKKTTDEGIYENSGDDAAAATPAAPPQSSSTLSRSQNKDGLIYIDVEITNKASGTTGTIHGDDTRTNYSFVDFTKKGDPLPESDDEDEKEPSSP